MNMELKIWDLVCLLILAVIVTVRTLWEAWRKNTYHPVVKWYITIVYSIVWIGLLYIGRKAIVNYD